MKKGLAPLALVLFLTGCATASGTFVDVAAKRYINEGKIYIGMSGV